MADPKEMAERLTGMAAWLAHSGYNADAATVRGARDLIERLTVEELAGVMKQSLMMWSGLDDDQLRQRVASDILNHLTTGTEAQG